MPTRDQIEYPRNDASIYLMKKNKTFQNNCCNTQHLVQMINKKFPETNFRSENLRSLIEGDHNTLVTVVGNDAPPGVVIKFDKSTLQFINKTMILGIILRSIGYWDNKYYLGTTNSIEIYDETLTINITKISTPESVTTIRFLNGTYMLVGVSKFGVFIYEKDANGIFTNNTSNIIIGNGSQIHAITKFNESAFYVGWYQKNMNLTLVTKGQTNAWIQSTTDTIVYEDETSDIIFDDQCKRIWVIQAGKNQTFIYDLNKTNRSSIVVEGRVLFNLLILDNSTYTLAISTTTGLIRIQPDVNCRPPP
jgi:hypothetical protein